MQKPTRKKLLDFVMTWPPALCRAAAIVHMKRGAIGNGRPLRIKTMDELVRDCSGLSRRTIERLVWRASWEGVDLDVASKFIDGCEVDLFSKVFARWFITQLWDKGLPHMTPNDAKRLRKVLGME